MSRQTDALLLKVAQSAGLMPAWIDAHGKEREVGADTLRAVLETLGFPCGSEVQCRESLARLEQGADATADAGLLLVRLGRSFTLRREGSLHYQLTLENGTRVMGTAQDLGGGRVAIPAIRKPGYHRLEMGRIQCTVAVVPEQAPRVEDLLRRQPAARPMTRGQPSVRGWVLGAQVYALRRGQTEGEPVPDGWQAGGDFSLLGTLAREAGNHGAAGLAISPLHAMFSADPQRYSPYSPSSRLFLNAMYADPATVLGADCLGALSQGGEARWLDPTDCLDWPAIQSTRLAQLERVFERFEATARSSRHQDLQAFELEGGEALARHVCYEALHAHFSATLGATHGWQDWPAEFRDPASTAVRHFAESHERALRFHVFLQWLAARSLAHAQAEARAHTPLGLIADLAVGTDPRGSHAWSRQQQVMTGVSVGAPPDLFQPRGQDWGLTAFSPWALRQHGHAGFIETVRAVLAHAGGLRVDHVIGLARLWLVPQGASADQGVYLGYPQDELMDLLMLEAWRHQAVIVGENLGTVPQGFNADLERRGFLGMSVLWFEREEEAPQRFHPPSAWPVRSMAMASTHDLPTLRGWWMGRDIHWRERHGEHDAAEAQRQTALREQDKTVLWTALQQAGLAPAGVPVPEAAPVNEVLSFLAATPSVLLNVALEDLAGESEQPNLPGRPPTDAALAHPNWRRTLGTPVDSLFATESTAELLEALRRAGRCASTSGARS